MSSVLFLVHPDRPAAKELSATARAWWEAHGYAVVDVRDIPGAFEAVGLETSSDSTPEFAISFGGDGTMLRTVQLAVPSGIPVIGVNLGRMGYLSEVEPAGMEEAFDRLLAGRFRVEDRVTLQVVLRRDGSPPELVGTVVNEAIVERNAPGHTIHAAVDIAGARFLTYIADGLLVCTPTGSTAYNLSARGPVVSPSMRALVLTAVAPHIVFDRSLVLGPDEEVTVTLLGDRPATLVLDGSFSQILGEGDAVTCSVASKPARFVVLGTGDFHAVLRDRFSLPDR